MCACVRRQLVIRGTIEGAMWRSANDGATRQEPRCSEPAEASSSPDSVAKNIKRGLKIALHCTRRCFRESPASVSWFKRRADRLFDKFSKFKVDRETHVNRYLTMQDISIAHSALMFTIAQRVQNKVPTFLQIFSEES
ncbi:uncharacterized protein LOC107273602 [Cephus cinctus]|uniref:Uncharacterized protein LOC107273602 n=1 Tax=Cephus cinctus TaxID=211228 RepID=A0AAJ7FTG2_CEPCN|nr:uncharacterized protein LOC107273602 [Cephus cinctus]